MKSLHLLLAPLALAGLLAAPVFAREITHAMRVSDVPDNPQRVVVLTNEGNEALLAVGIKPVGAVESWKGNPWYDYLMPELEDPLWLGLGAVKADQAKRVDDATRIAAGGIFAANIVLDDIEATYGLASTR